MSIDYEYLGQKMDELFRMAKLKLGVDTMNDIKLSLGLKADCINRIIELFKNFRCGKLTAELTGNLEEVCTSYNELANNIDDKLMIFIVGSGSTGKSTLLNALVGYEVAKTDELPSTWKIDVYSPSLKDNTAVIKYADGSKTETTVKKAKDLVEAEERKTKDSKSIYNTKLKEEIKNYKTKEERDELKNTSRKSICTKVKCLKSGGMLNRTDYWSSVFWLIHPD